VEPAWDLPIVKHIAQTQNGGVEVKSVKGEGSGVALLIGGCLQSSRKGFDKIVS
jgi:hypothetical protein